MSSDATAKVHAGITIALSKGRILSQSLPLLAAIGVVPEEDPDSSRRLVLETGDPQVRLLVLRAQDVPTFVEHGAADVGVAGKDVLLEHTGDGLYEPLDLGIARCRLVVAGRSGEALPQRRARIATKYVTTAARHFAEKGMQVEIIKLYGSMELAPLVGLADRIVDLVDSGNTLRANGLVEFEHIADVSSRLIVNKASMKMKSRQIKRIVQSLGEAVRAAAGTASS